MSAAATGAKVVTLKQPAPAEAHATLRGVTRIFQLPKSTLHALGPIDLDLAKGEFFSVVGPSGCGKSTLLDILAGLSAPQAGTAHFEGKPTGSASSSRRTPPSPGSMSATTSPSGSGAPGSTRPRSSAVSTTPSASWG